MDDSGLFLFEVYFRLLFLLFFTFFSLGFGKILLLAVSRRKLGYQIDQAFSLQFYKCFNLI